MNKFTQQQVQAAVEQELKECYPFKQGYLLQGTFDDIISAAFKRLESQPEVAGKEVDEETDSQKLVEIAILFNDGVLDPEKLADMVGMCMLVLDRYKEHGDISKSCSKEKLINENNL